MMLQKVLLAVEGKLTGTHYTRTAECFISIPPDVLLLEKNG
jgi:hypothetical protein